MTRNSLYLLFIISLLFINSACQKDDDNPLVSTPPKEDKLDEKELISLGAFDDYGNIDIHTFANGNSWDTFIPNYIKDISGRNYGYCHPDVEYFPNGFEGYKFWMAFTPYFGSIGSSGESIYYENPSIVVSNDGLNWIEPKSKINPLQLRPSIKDGVVRNNGDTLQGYWSDTDLLFRSNQLELYYRGNSISLKTMNRIASKSLNNLNKLNKSAIRSIVKQTSSNGKDWGQVELLYSSNEPETINNNDLLSPSFVHVDNTTYSYEVLFNTGEEGYRESDNSFLLRRSSTNGLDFTDFKQSNIVRFVNAPWKEHANGYSPWHVQAVYIDGVYYLMLAVGRARSYTSDDLYMAYSKDGLHFYVYPKPLVRSGVYRSCLFPIHINQHTVELGAIIGLKSGQFKYRKFLLNKKILNKVLA